MTIFLLLVVLAQVALHQFRGDERGSSGLAQDFRKLANRRAILGILPVDLMFSPLSDVWKADPSTIHLRHAIGLAPSLLFPFEGLFFPYLTWRQVRLQLLFDALAGSIVHHWVTCGHRKQCSLGIIFGTVQVPL